MLGKQHKRLEINSRIWIFLFLFIIAVDLSGTSDEENITPPWHNETTMTISETPEKTKKRQQRKTKSTKKTLIQEEEEEEDDEETKAYKQRLRNVNYSSKIYSHFFLVYYSNHEKFIMMMNLNLNKHL